MEFPLALLAAVAAEMGMVGLGHANGGDWLDEGEVLPVEKMQQDMKDQEEWKKKKKSGGGQETQDPSDNEVRYFLRQPFIDICWYNSFFGRRNLLLALDKDSSVLVG